MTGKPFEPTAFELRPETKSPRWTLQIHNASAPCAKSRKLGDDVVLVTLDGIGGEGSWPIDEGETHFQRGFYMSDDPSDPEIETGSGRVRLDAAPGAVGTTVTGALRAIAASSEIGGAFTATVCGPF